MLGFPLKERSAFQNDNISYGFSVWQTGFQSNSWRFSWQPTWHFTLPSAGGPQLPGSSVLAYSFCENLPKLGAQTHKYSMWTLLSGLTLVSGKTSPHMSMRTLVLPFSLDQSWIILLSRHWSISAILAVWKVWLRLWLWVSSFSGVEPRGGRGWLIHLLILI